VTASVLPDARRKLDRNPGLPELLLVLRVRGVARGFLRGFPGSAVPDTAQVSLGVVGSVGGVHLERERDDVLLLLLPCPRGAELRVRGEVGRETWERFRAATMCVLWMLSRGP